MLCDWEESCGPRSYISSTWVYVCTSRTKAKAGALFLRQGLLRGVWARGGAMVLRGGGDSGAAATLLREYDEAVGGSAEQQAAPPSRLRHHRRLLGGWVGEWVGARVFRPSGLWGVLRAGKPEATDNLLRGGLTHSVTYVRLRACLLVFTYLGAPPTRDDLLRSGLWLLTFSDGHVYRRRRADRSLHELPIGTLQSINCTVAATHASRVAGAC